MTFLSPADFFNINLSFLKKSFRNTIRVSNSLEPDQARHYVWPDMGPTCLQTSSADDKSSHLAGSLRVKQFLHSQIGSAVAQR